jgi:hypothetical protein
VKARIIFGDKEKKFGKRLTKKPSACEIGRGYGIFTIDKLVKSRKP